MNRHLQHPDLVIRQRRAARRRPDRRGLAIALVLIVLAVGTVMLGVLTRSLIAQVKSCQQVERSRQAQWLAQAGISRAAAQLARTPNYTGETWQIGADELDGHDAAQIVIRIETPPNGSSDRIVQIVADYPAELPHRCRVTRELPLAIGPTGTEK